MAIRNVSTTPSKSYHTMGSRKITTQPGEIDDRKPEVIAFVVNACINASANNF